MAEIAQVADRTYRICYYNRERTIGFNQFLIDDDRPALIHTGHHPMYEAVRAAVAEIVDPSRLAYVVVPHFESDECGGMGRFVAEAKGAVLACSAVGAVVNLLTWDYAGPVEGMQDGDTLDLGAHTLRFLETPHVHHWDSMMVFDEGSKSLFASDLFIQPHEQPAIVCKDLAGEMCEWYRTAGIFASEEPVRWVVDRIEQLDPDWIHPMHGGSLAKETLSPYVRALRTEPYAFDGRVLGRRLPR